MWRSMLFVGIALSLAAPAWAQTRDEKVRGDRQNIQSDGNWIYNDLAAGFDEAKKSGKPLLVVFRCVP